MAEVAKKKRGGIIPGTSTLGGKPGWHWMDMAEHEENDPRTYYRPDKEKEWRKARPYGTDYKEDYSKPETHDIKVRLDGGALDEINSQGGWSENCVEMHGGKEVVISYSGGSVKESGAIGSGAWHVKGCSLPYSHKEYPGIHALFSGRVELLYTLRCMHTIRANG